jgi:polynucleotide 5'-kinase involved in rRNA processing
MQIDPFLSPCTKLKYKWIKEFHIKLYTLKLLEEKMGKSLEYMGTGEKIPEQNSNGLCCKIKN